MYLLYLTRSYILPLKPGYVVSGTNDKVFNNFANDANTRKYFVK